MAGLTVVTPAQQHAITYTEASDYLRLDDQQDVDLFNQQYGVNLNIPQEG